MGKQFEPLHSVSSENETYGGEAEPRRPRRQLPSSPLPTSFFVYWARTGEMFTGHNANLRRAINPDIYILLFVLTQGLM